MPRLPASAAVSGQDGNGGSARLFIALWPDDATRRRLASRQAACDWPAAARPVPAGQLHLTLHFLGPVERRRIAGLLRAIADLPAPPFDLRLGRAAVWSNGVAVLEPCGEPPPGLIDLQARLGAVLRQLGLPVEARRFRPHVTLARRAAGAVLPADGPTSCWRVAGPALIESGHGYRVLWRPDDAKDGAGADGGQAGGSACMTPASWLRRRPQRTGTDAAGVASGPPRSVALPATRAVGAPASPGQSRPARPRFRTRPARPRGTGSTGGPSRRRRPCRRRPAVARSTRIPKAKS